jgi:hypothetical protein
VDYSLFWYLGNISTFIPLVPIIFSLFIFKRFTPIQQLLIVWIILAFSADVLAYYAWQTWQNNNPIYHVYAVVEFFLILRIFKLALPKLLTKKRFIFVYFSFLTFAVINAIAWQSVLIFNSNVTTVTAFMIIVLVLLYFYSLLLKEDLGPLGKMPIFWMSAGMMLYFTTNFILFFLSKNQDFSLEHGYTIWGIHAAVNILSICFYTYALWIQPKTE